MFHRHASPVGCAFLFACVTTASCSNNDDPGFPQVGSGGTAGTTAVATGGATSNAGGKSATGGTVAQGGQATGGAISTGGTAQAGATTGGAGGNGGATVGGTSAAGASTGGTTASAGTAGSAGVSAGAAGAAGGLPMDGNGKCGLQWAAGGTAGKPALDATVTPVRDAVTDDWTFTFGRMRLVVAAKRSGNVYEFSIDGNNIIEPSAGSTLWPSPQHRDIDSQNYEWPPAKELDGNPYNASLANNVLTLVGATATAPNTNISFTKRIWVNQASGVVTLEYTITNQASASASWAPWEVTRVPGGGYTFAPKGPGNRNFALASWERPMTLSLVNDVNWFDYATALPTMTEANYLGEFDGAEGWLAHARRVGSSSPVNLLLVKSFPDAQDAAMPSKEGEIQLWANGAADTKTKIIEVEQQGEMKTLAAKAQLTWTVRWFLCELPNTVSLAAGSADLVTYARAHAVSQP